jgi:spore germination cell wall hydrolase CwlJ-like protein
MTTTNALVEDTLACREANQKIAQILSRICAIVLVLASVAFAAKLLDWAIDQKGVDPDATSSTVITLEMRERQLSCLAKNIYYEAGNQPFEGKVAVAQVTINRVNSGQYPDDICKTIYQKNVVYEKVLCQFSWVCDRVTLARPVHGGNYKESMEVAKKVLLEGFRLPSLEKAMYFHGDYINPGWKRERVAKIGNHIFYK